MKFSTTQIESYIGNALQEWNIPGGAVAFIQNDELITCRGYGVRELGKTDPVDENTRFAIGSCTKAFTAAILGALVDEGKFGWDDKIVKFLPGFKLYDPWVTNQVTVRDMLCHRTSLMRSIRIMLRDRSFDADDYIRRMEFLQPVGEFRTRFAYGNPQYIVSARVAEIVTDQKWKDLVSNYIFERLGMTSSVSTYQDLLKSGVSNIACPHANLDGGLVPAELRALDAVQPIPWPDLGENAAGSIISSLLDMTTWMKLFLNDGNHQGKSIFSPEVAAEMTSPQMVIKARESEMDAIYAVGLPSNLLAYGLGWYVMDYRGYKMVFHPGQVNGFVAALAFMPQLKIGGMILLNTYQTLLHPMLGYFLIDTCLGIERDYSSEMQTLLRQWRAGAEQEINQMMATPPTRVPPPISPEQLTGRYVSNLFGEITINLEDDQLVHRYGETELYTAILNHWQELTFMVEYDNKINPPEFLTFFPDEQGRITSLSVKDVDVFRRV